MISFEKFSVENGLRVIVQRDKTTPLVTVNLLYDVGAKDEDPDKTGFAHLFEHLMFGGSLNIPQYDRHVQDSGGEHNAFTNNDITDYYINLPRENVETAFWLESDRMLQLAFSDKSLEVQRNVVIEEYKQRYLNQPYGDSWLLLRPLAYKVHPYQWATIGKDISHIEKASMHDVKDFFYSHYAPNNAILSVIGNVSTEDIKKLTEKWFGPIEKRGINRRNLPSEPIQTEERRQAVYRDVPFDSVYKAYHICKRTDPVYYTCDLISDILSNGKSSRFYQELVMKRNLFTELFAYLTGDIDEGLLIINGKLVQGVCMEEAENAINEETEKLKIQPVSDYELQKVKNKVESAIQLSETNALNKAISLAYHELLGDAANINSEATRYLAVTAEQIKNTSCSVFSKENCSTLHYLSGKNRNQN